MCNYKVKLEDKSSQEEKILNIKIESHDDFVKWYDILTNMEGDKKAITYEIVEEEVIL